MRDEIVCETVEAFRVHCDQAGADLFGAPLPGDSVTFRGKTIIYRPPPPRDVWEDGWGDWLARNNFRFGLAPAQDLCRESFLAGRASVKP